MDTQINGSMHIPGKMFYHKISLKQKINDIKDPLDPTSGQIYLNSPIMNSNFLESFVILPCAMAKLDVEMFIQNFVFYKLNNNQEKIDLELYLDNSRIAVAKNEFVDGNFIQSIYLTGTAYNVPAGPHRIFLKVVTMNNDTAQIAFRRVYTNRPPNTDFSFEDPTDSTDAATNIFPGYLEVVGYPLLQLDDEFRDKKEDKDEKDRDRNRHGRDKDDKDKDKDDNDDKDKKDDYSRDTKDQRDFKARYQDHSNGWMI